jgi:hypothetical protein
VHINSLEAWEVPRPRGIVKSDEAGAREQGGERISLGRLPRAGFAAVVAVWVPTQRIRQDWAPKENVREGGRVEDWRGVP